MAPSATIRDGCRPFWPPERVRYALSVGGLSSLRASDSDREQAAERLRHATAEGRLTADELDERLESLYGSRTYGELDALLADLPADRPLRPRATRAGLPWWVGAAGATALLLAVLGLLSGGVSHASGAFPEARRAGTFPGPPVSQPHHLMLAAASRLAVVALLAVCATLAWLVLRARRPSDA